MAKIFNLYTSIINHHRSFFNEIMQNFKTALNFYSHFFAVCKNLMMPMVTKMVSANDSISRISIIFDVYFYSYNKKSYSYF